MHSRSRSKVLFVILRLGRNRYETWGSTMKRYLLLALAACAFVIVAPSAMAVRVRVVDPTAIPCASDAPCSIYNLDTPFIANFVSCSHPPAGPIPHSVNTAGFTYCLWLNNVTGSGAGRIDFELRVPADAVGQSLECDSDAPSVLVAVVCPTSLPTTAGASFTISFISNPPLADNHDFYLLTDFAVDPGSAGVTLSVPEPGELGLFGLGLLGIGLGYSWKKRRQSDRAHYAA
jgi:hypothetical protein